MDRSLPVFYVSVVTDSGLAMTVDETARVLSLEYEDCEKKADRLKLTVDNRDLRNFENPLWRKGGKVLVTWGYAGGLMSPTRRCIIEKVTGFEQLSVEALDEGYQMNLWPHSRTFTNVTRADVARQLATEYGYGPDQRMIEDTARVFPTITQARQTDGEFLRRLAHLEGFACYVDFDGFHFHGQDLRQRVSRVFEWFSDPRQGDIKSMNVEQDRTTMPDSQRVVGRDPEQRQDIDATLVEPPPFDPESYRAAIEDAQDPLGVYNSIITTYGLVGQPEDVALAAITVAERNRRFQSEQITLQNTWREEERQQAELDRPFETGEWGIGDLASVVGNFWHDQYNERRQRQNAPHYAEYVATQRQAEQRQVVQDHDDALARARAEAQREQNERTVKIAFDAIGDPSLLAKSVIEVRGIGRRLSGYFYVTDVTTKIDASGYTMSVKCWSDGTQGYQEVDLFAVPRPNARPVPQYGNDDDAGGESFLDPRNAPALTPENRVSPDGTQYQVNADNGGRNSAVQTDEASAEEAAEDVAAFGEGET